jgi:hypothetical protein
MSSRDSKGTGGDFGSCGTELCFVEEVFIIALNIS